jgi:diguanylate cyclase
MRAALNPLDSMQEPQDYSPIPRSGVLDRRLARSAFWVMTRRVTVMAAGVDLGFLILFGLLRVPELAWVNLVSMAMYGSAYWLLLRKHNNTALVLIWLEVIGHALLGTLLGGWDSGFHYYLLMFIPACVVGTRVTLMALLLALLATSYLGMHAASHLLHHLVVLQDWQVQVVLTFNVIIVFMMATYVARYYANQVRRAERKLVEVASKDSLSGLSNRRNLMSFAHEAIAAARRQHQAVSVLLVDIDHFKAINDRYGHEAGDQVIMQVGSQLAHLCRAQDMAARWGGEEFLLLLPGTALADAGLVAERIRQAPGIYRATTVHGNPSGTEDRYTLSIGVAELTPTESLSQAIARADRALYQSKATGRDRVTLALPQQSSTTPDHPAATVALTPDTIAHQPHTAS